MPTQATPWAILLTKWNDHNDEPQSQAFYADLFTQTGSGTSNMVDFFYAMSHETLDLTGSEVHGWFTLNRPQTDYVGNTYPEPSGKLNRDGLMDLARSTASANGVDLSKFWGVVVVMNTPTDLCGWIGGRKALCDPPSLMPMLLGQEMGHGYGLQHSRVDGSTNDYQDPWDIMSTWDSTYYTASAEYTWIGPGLNAANMRSMGWLDESRVWKATTSGFSQQIELRPLHRHDLPGFLAAELAGPQGAFLVEFRPGQGWDAGFPRWAVFVHRLQDGHSYRMLGQSGSSDLVVGDSFSSGVNLPFLSHSSVAIDEINESREYAMVTLSHRPAEPIHIDGIFGEIFGGVAVDGGGVIIVGGVPHPVPPWAPFASVLEQIAAYSAADMIVDPIARIEAKKSALGTIVTHAGARLAELTGLETPPPPPKGWKPGKAAPSSKRTASRKPRNASSSRSRARSRSKSSPA